MPGVTITVNNSGDFAYSAALLHVGAGDVITWNTGAETGAFAITFRPDTPLAAGGVALESGGPANTIVGTVRNVLPIEPVYSNSLPPHPLPDPTSSKLTR